MSIGPMTISPTISRTSSPVANQEERSEYGRPSAWCTSAGKRVFDVAFTTMFLVVSFPLMLLASIAVLTSPGPLFFSSNRVGRGGKPIRVLKFRTMHHRKELGVQLTRRGDDRITAAGRFLRKWKIDELPQFFNVVRGDMSLIGPRPDSAEFLDTLPVSARCTLESIRPGITSIATVRFRNKEEILRQVPENEMTSYYIQILLPQKISLDLEYASRATFSSDLNILLQTALAIVR